MTDKLLLLFSWFLFASVLAGDASAALTPIAHTDVVPYQRIEHGTAFEFGVVAFSKAGIDRVEFDISGQGYSNGTKTTDEMTLNTRVASTSPGAVYPGVWEYWIPISSSEFTGNGLITVAPTVYGSDGGTKELDAVTLYVEGATDEAPTEAWVDAAGSDGTGTLNDEGDPFPDISSAISAIQSANGDCDYATIYLAEDVYNTGITGSTITNDEWLTITRESGAAIENVIIDEHGTSYNTDHIKMQGVTLYASGHADYAIDTTGAWIDRCRIIGNAEASGPPFSFDNPVRNAEYITSSYGYDLSFGIMGGPTAVDIVRGYSLNHTFDDFSQNKEDILYVNIRANDIWGTFNQPAEGWHADFFQLYNAECNGNTYDNIIFYNVIATRLQYGSIFLNGYGTMGNPHTNIAFVNTFLEWRNPTTQNRAWIYDAWDHFLMWHCTISISDETPLPQYGLWKLSIHDYPDPCTPDTQQLQDNASYIGNVLYGFEIQPSAGNPRGTTYLNSGNPYGNEAKYNHYENESATNIGEDYTLGRNVLDWNDPNDPDTYGYPVGGSAIVDSVPDGLIQVPCDAYGNPRDSSPDRGALEYGSDAPPIYQCSDGLDNDGDGDIDYPGDSGCSSATDDSEAECGNYMVEGGEECDDGNLVDGDGCDSSCSVEVPAGNVYYVRTDGHDTNCDGSQDEAEGDGTCAWLTVQKAADTMVAGDIVYIADGTYADTVTITTSGTSESPITYKGESTSTHLSRQVGIYADHVVMDTLRFGDPTKAANSGSTAIWVYGDHNTIQNVLFDPDNVLGNGGNGAISFESGADHNILTDFECRDMNFISIILFQSGSAYNTVRNGVIHGTWDVDYFRPQGAYNTIQDIEAYGNVIDNWPEQHCDFMQVQGSGGVTGHDIIIENCYVHDTDMNIGYMTVDNNPNVYGYTFRNNVFFNVSGELRISVPECKVYNNVFYHTGVDSPFGKANPGTIEDYTGQIQLGGATGVYDSTGVSITNNAFVTEIYPWLENGNGIQTYNHSYNYYGDLDNNARDYYVASGGIVTSISETGKVAGGDPSFGDFLNHDFSLDSGSILIDKGIALGTFSQDKIGVSRPQGAGWDIGAYEFVPEYHRADVNPQDGCIVIGELMSFISRWKASLADVSLEELMEAIGLWKAGTGC